MATAVNEQVAAAVLKGNLDEAKLLAERMKRSHGVAPDATTLHILVDAFLLEKRLSDAEACVEQFTTMFSIVPAVETLQAVIRATMTAKGPLAATKAAHGIKKNFSVAADTDTQDMITVALLDERLPVEAAEFLVANCAASGVPCEAVLCERVLMGLMAKKKAKKAKEFVVHCPAQPTQRMVGSVLDMLQTAGKLDEAAQLAAQLWMKFRAAAEVKALNRLIQAYVTKGRFEHAIRMVKAMQKSYGVAPEPFSCNLIVHALVKLKRVAEAHEVLNAMVPEMGVTPNCITISSVIAGYAKAGQVEKAKAMIESMERVWAVRPEIVTHNSIISALCQEGRAGEAEDYMRTLRCRKEARTFGPLVRAAVKRKDLAKARELWRLLERDQVVPDTFLWNGILAAEAAMGTIDSLEDTFRSMGRSAAKPNSLTLRIMDDARKARDAPAGGEMSRDRGPSVSFSHGRPERSDRREERREDRYRVYEERDAAAYAVSDSYADHRRDRRPPENMYPRARDNRDREMATRQPPAQPEYPIYEERRRYSPPHSAAYEAEPRWPERRREAEPYGRSPPLHHQEERRDYGRPSAQELPLRQLPPRTYSPRDISPRELQQRGYSPREAAARDASPRYSSSRDLPPHDLPPRDLHPRAHYRDERNATGGPPANERARFNPYPSPRKQNSRPAKQPHYPARLYS